jgi:uncharacterized integral membrane protein
MVSGLIRFWLFLAAAAFGAYILSFNRDLVLISIPGVGEYEIILAVALILSFIIGATVMLLYQIQEIIIRSFEMRKLRKQIRQLEKEVCDLKAPVGFSE